MASPPTTGRRNAKHYILAGLTATLAAAVIVTIFFVVLSPARIYFSVTNASILQEEQGGVVLAFTLAANNTGIHTRLYDITPGGKKYNRLVF